MDHGSPNVHPRTPRVVELIDSHHLLEPASSSNFLHAARSPLSTMGSWACQLGRCPVCRMRARLTHTCRALTRITAMVSGILGSQGKKEAKAAQQTCYNCFRASPLSQAAPNHASAAPAICSRWALTAILSDRAQQASPRVQDCPDEDKRCPTTVLRKRGEKIRVLRCDIRPAKTRCHQMSLPHKALLCSG